MVYTIYISLCLPGYIFKKFSLFGILDFLAPAYRFNIKKSKPYIFSSLFLVIFIGNEWWDLCAGPHVESTGNINTKAIELESVAGAYWRGDTNKPMLQRIYGTAWENEEQLKAYLHFKEEAKRRDHRRIGQDLDLFSIQVTCLRFSSTQNVPLLYLEFLNP